MRPRLGDYLYDCHRLLRLALDNLQSGASSASRGLGVFSASDSEIWLCGRLRGAPLPELGPQSCDVPSLHRGMSLDFLGYAPGKLFGQHPGRAQRFG